jgi:beta-carotene 3-hydroxylase
VTLPGALLVVVTAFVLMEPVTALTHRFVMHGIGRRLHRSHHQPNDSRFELNDWFPLMFASIVMLGLWACFNLHGFAALVPAGVGVTLYGLAYALVHDAFIHRRVGWFASHPADGRPGRTLDRLAAAHRIHHEHNRAPFGMLFPVVPRELRDRPVDCNSAPARF